MALPPLRYRAVLFDLDGTLVDSYAALTEAVNHARRAHGLEELSVSHIRGSVGDGLDMLLRRSFDTEDVPRSAREAFESRYDEICCEKSTILSDVESTLKSLHDLGVVMAVCTNKRTRLSRKILTFLELAPFFSAIVGPDLAGAAKPAAKHVLHALEATECAVADALFVGDMPVDVQAARNSGMDIAVIATGSATQEELTAAQPDHLLGRFSDLLNLITVPVISN